METKNIIEWKHYKSFNKYYLFFNDTECGCLDFYDGSFQWAQKSNIIINETILKEILKQIKVLSK